MKGQKTIMKLNVFNRKKTVLEKLTSTYDVKLDASASQLIMDVLAKLYDNPIEVHLPEDSAPYLSIKDHGNGLDYLGIVSVFANFGTSTKRDSDNLIGGFGIGSKSGLAVSNTINVSSVCNGILNKFVLERTNDGIA